MQTDNLHLLGISYGRPIITVIYLQHDQVSQVYPHLAGYQRGTGSRARSV